YKDSVLFIFFFGKCSGGNNVFLVTYSHIMSLTKSSGFTFGFQKAEDVAFPHRAFNVTDNVSGWVIREFNLDLSDTTTRTGAAENFENFGVFDGAFRILIILNMRMN